ncbi:MAG: AmmeMemoRadiSam system protein A, partial [Gammaproteobacteria bacterium]|nr:AmmeMemoRadiSam system protein A [Gammaproteobacteria bacterium]
LRGCIGSLEAHRPLVEDIAHNARAAAFSDPRFSPVTAQELPALEFHLSVLSPAVPLRFESETDLLEQIRPGIDGLVLEDGPHRGTFLPAVWESLPDAAQFLQHLKLKAGLPKDHWSDTLKISRYTTQTF